MAVIFHCQCGKQLQAPEEFVGRASKCPGCGQPVTVPAPQTVQAAVPPTQAVSLVLPPSGRPPQIPIAADDGIRLATPATSGQAIASLALGIGSFCMPVFVLNLPAIILGILSLSKINQSQGRLTGKGLAISGIITGAVSMLLVLPAVMLGALFMTAVSKAKEAANRIDK